MTKRLGIVLLACIITFSLYAKSSTGIYISVYNYSNSWKYSDNFSEKLPSPYLNGQFNATFSIYNENLFEVNFILNTENLTDPKNPDMKFLQYGFGFELGKVISTDIRIKGKNFISPDLSAGIYTKMNPFSQKREVDPQEKTSQFGFSYGMYISFKMKIHTFQRILRSKSIDIGYKFYIPVYSNNQPEDFSIINYSHLVYLGFSF